MSAATQGTRRLNPRAVITGAIFLAVIGLAIWYLARPEPLLVQGEVESTRVDIAAWVSGCLAKIPVVRGRGWSATTTSIPSWSALTRSRPRPHCSRG